tara:strand:- start:786 stop:1409 length:624 start_codon:yes stop_codon:yes gene_type:complete
MIRDIISNDSLTILLFGSIFFIIILKKIDPVIFSHNLSFRKKELVNKISTNLWGIKFLEILYNLLFISNISILLAFFKDQNFDLIIYYELFKYIFIFYTSKVLFDIIIGKVFSINGIMKSYVWQKLVYCNSLGIILLLFNFFIAYTIYDKQYIISFFIALSVLYLIFAYFSIFFSMKKVIYKNWFYFILYLCTLEIIPYYYLISNVL